MFSEGDIEVSEAVDFANYYAATARELDSVAGAVFVPSKVTVVTPPWNFPVAIPTGGVLASLAAGSGVVFKPAPQARRCAAVIAEALWDAGVPRDVLALVDIDEGGLAETAALLRECGGVCEAQRVDLADEAQIRQFGVRLCRAHPRLDVLVNNAGLAYGEIASGFTDLSQEKWLRYFAINAVAPLLLGQAVRPALAAAKGNVINITSMASYMPATAYGVTKATTLAQVAESLGVAAAEVIAFGDMPNDLAMLTWAGRSFAMADAHPEVRACAGDVAPSHEEDGVARVLAEVFDL